jgi:hypothetical protein
MRQLQIAATLTRSPIALQAYSPNLGVSSSGIFKHDSSVSLSGDDPEASENFLIETRSLPTLTRSYPRRFTFYVARPTRSIPEPTRRLTLPLVHQ